MQDFIELERMRYDYDVQMQLKVAEEVKQLSVLPFSFIAFVENAFKHGDLKNEASPLFIQFAKEEQHLAFTIHNAKRKQQKDQTGGIGLGNIKKRLELVYDHQHELEIEETEQLFKVHLKIPLSLC